MELIQTINCGSNYSLLEFQLIEIIDSDISGIRLNINRYIQNGETENLSRLFNMISKYKDRYKFLYDIPFPYNKTRIIEYNINGGIIEKDKIYSLYFEQDGFENASDDAILLSKFKKLYDNSVIVYYGDGQGAFEVIKEEKDKVIVKAICDFQIYKKKSITYGKSSTKDKIEPISNIISDICTPIDYGCALSLVENSEDINNFRSKVDKQLPIVSKIETQESIKNLDEITKKSNGIMLARGDLALLNPYYNLYHILKEIIATAKHHHKKIYLATDILQSMDCGRCIPSRPDIIDLSLACSWDCDYIILGYHPNTDILKRKINAAEQICNGYKNNELFRKRTQVRSI